MEITAQMFWGIQRAYQNPREPSPVWNDLPGSEQSLIEGLARYCNDQFAYGDQVTGESLWIFRCQNAPVAYYTRWKRLPFDVRDTWEQIARHVSAVYKEGQHE